MSDELFGTVLDDRFVLGAPIGQGRAGVVYDGRTIAGESVAVKMLRPTLSRSRMHVDRFLESAKITASIVHPSIVRVLGCGRIPGQSAWVAMERIAGVPLQRLVAECGSLPWSRARALALDTCAALAAAHAREIVHGALDPSRVFVVVGASGRESIKLTDFGIAGEGSGPEIWPAAAAYRPPERRQGEPASVRGDVFTVGALLFEMLAGRSPKPGASLRAEGIAVPDVVDELVTKAIARDPSRRYRNVDALHDALTPLGDVGHAPPRIDPAITGRTERPPPRRSSSEPLDEEDVTTVRPDRRAPTFAPPRASNPMPAKSGAARPAPAVAEDPTPPPMLPPIARGAAASAASPRRAAQTEPEPEDRTSLLAGGFRLPAQEQTAILPAPTAGHAALGGDDPPELTMVVEYRPPGASGSIGMHAITARPPGAAREETAILDITDIEVHDIAAATGVLGPHDLPVMREETQVLGMDRKDEPSDPSVSMTAVIDASIGRRVSGAIHTRESPVPIDPRLGSGPVIVAAPGGYTLATGAFPPVPSQHAPIADPHAAAPSAIAGFAPLSGGYPPVSGGFPPVSGGFPVASGGYPVASGGYPVASGGYPVASGRHSPVSSDPRSGASIAVVSSHGAMRRRARNNGMVMGVAIGVLIAVAILGGGAIAGLWLASK